MTTEPARRGRKRDHTRDIAILDAALDVLADTGYAGFTIDAVVERAGVGRATVYRRWASKEALVVDALGRLDAETVGRREPADTGSLAGDLRAELASHPEQDDDRRLRIMAGVTSLLGEHPALADAANAAVVEPWVELNRVLLRRAAARGELAPGADIETLAWVVPAMATYRVGIQRKPIPTGYVAQLLDEVLLPAAGVSARVRG